jgi:hypothetical protein
VFRKSQILYFLETSLKNTGVKNNNRDYCRIVVIITVLVL